MQKSPKLPFTKTENKKTPPMITFKSLNVPALGLAKSPSMMMTSSHIRHEVRTSALTRSNSVPVEDDENSLHALSQNGGATNGDYKQQQQHSGITNGKTGNGDDLNNNNNRSKVLIPKLYDDESFTNFFTKIQKTVINESSEKVEIADFDDIKVSTEKLIQQRKCVQGPRGRRAAKNPLKSLAAREDLQNEYTEIKTGIAEKEMKRIKFESIAKTSNLAIEALAGLASIEDFKSVSLKSSAIPLNKSWLPYKSLMLLHVKGRRHIQTRLVEPTYKSINSGDCFILINGKKLYNYTGKYANVIEKSRSKDICAQIIRDKDMGCTATSVTLITNNNPTSNNTREFWRLLKRPNVDGDDVEINGGVVDNKISDAGHCDEDELFESCLIETNMVYELIEDKLVPVEEYWGQTLKISMLESHKVLVFNFGSEIYIWNGKSAQPDDKKIAIKLAHEQFMNEYNYEMCYLNPINYSLWAGDRNNNKMIKSDQEKPEWCLLAKITQYMETVLFREKFVDWPDIAIQFANGEDLNCRDLNTNIQGLDGDQLYKALYEEPNLTLENSNLGRGNLYYDQDTMRHYDIITKSVGKWKINEYNYDKHCDAQARICHFYSSESYIIRWIYQISVTVRELSGKISQRNTAVGRDRCVYFCWQGTDSTPNEKGAAALLTIELDKEKGSQLRIAQGHEVTAFVRLFEIMFIHKQKFDANNYKMWRLYIVSGNEVSETVLTEVTCNMRQLRSRSSMILLNGELGKVIIWNGAKSLPHMRSITQAVGERMKSERYAEIFSVDCGDGLVVSTLEEGNESDEFFIALGSKNRNLYHSLIDSKNLNFNYTPRLFHFTSSNNGKFEVNEIFYNLRLRTLDSPFPFAQSQLYNARQPTIFMIDNGHCLWLWLGWWPQEDYDNSSGSSSSSDDNDSNPKSIENRSGENRWQAERRAAMETAVSYWNAKQRMEQKQRGDSTSDSDDENGRDEVDDDKCDRMNEINGYVVWAGLEPLEFTNLFPDWVNRDDVAEINIQVSNH